MSISSLPRDTILEITGFLNYSDILSLLFTCKGYYSLSSSEEYWKKVASSKYKPTYLSWQGLCAKESTLEGVIFRGSENFTGIDHCFQEAYKKGDMDLLSYFIRFYIKDKRMCYLHVFHTTEGVHPHLNILENLLFQAICDHREEVVTLLIKEVPQWGLDRLSYYIMAKSRGQKEATRSLLPTTKYLEWLVYALQTKDRLIFDSLFPGLSMGHKGALYSLFEIYPWPEVETEYNISEWQALALPIYPGYLKVEIPVPAEKLTGAKNNLRGVLMDIGNYEHEKARDVIYHFWSDEAFINDLRSSSLPRLRGTYTNYMKEIKEKIYNLSVPAFAPIKR